jgi:hypothetical protein
MLTTWDGIIAVKIFQTLVTGPGIRFSNGVAVCLPKFERISYPTAPAIKILFEY